MLAQPGGGPAGKPNTRFCAPSWPPNGRRCRLDGLPLPALFTHKGERPERPAWCATPTVAYAVEPGCEVQSTAIHGARTTRSSRAVRCRGSRRQRW
ncbi:hypothetical protein EJC51_46395 [Streptomyces aquilus]|uniref:Uncharacterized protein n=1 Tax=Streptomyces aquilus TaxID=2548456 RepID=A0A3S9IEV1_9ACTN|nr:hypothetical protein EJC51_46395 [Streptomyces aquilus]